MVWFHQACLSSMAGPVGGGHATCGRGARLVSVLELPDKPSLFLLYRTCTVDDRPVPVGFAVVSHGSTMVRLQQ